MAAAYTNTEVTESVRRSLEPSALMTYLPQVETYTTPSLTIGTLTKMLVSTDVNLLRDFVLVDTGGGDMRYQYQGAVAREVLMTVVTGVTASATNITFQLGIYRNNDGFLDDLVGETFRGSGTDPDQFIVSGYILLQPLDTLSFWAKLLSGSTTTLTFKNMSIQILEMN